MTYAFDTNVFSQLFGSYYRSIFPSLWRAFEGIVASGRITSTSEVLLELGESRRTAAAFSWAIGHQSLFPQPTRSEVDFVNLIFRVPRFRQLAQSRNRAGRRVADSYLIARARTLGASVVTMERITGQGFRIPDICHYFNIPCINLQQFMEAEKWIF